MDSDDLPTPQETDNRDAGPAATAIVVHGGIHDGAVSGIPGDRISVVGSAGDCDIRLLDEGIESHHLAVGATGKGLEIRLLNGSCRSNGKTLRPGQRFDHAMGDRLVLGESGVSLSSRTRHFAAQTDGSRRPRKRAALYACAVLLAIAAAAFSQQMMLTEPAAPELTTGLIEILETLQIANDVKVGRDADTITVRGILPDEKFAALEAAVSTLPRNIVNRTQSAGSLLEQVHSVFRTNGYHAELNYLGEGVVQVKNLDSENPQIMQIAARIRADVPILTSLTFLPVSDANRSGHDFAIYSTDPDKRLTTIVDGDTAYVATTDGGRYFVGSVLPGGLLLRQISEDGIQVDRNGEIHWLAL